MLDLEPVYSTPRGEAVARFIARHYPNVSPSFCQLLSRGMNDIYLVITPAGERLIFRLSHHRARGKADVASETSFLVHLAGLGVPVAEPVPAVAGSLFVTGIAPEGIREGVLFQVLDGREPQATSAADACANGRTLALLHNAAETFSAAAAVYRLDLGHLLHRPLARIRESGLIRNAEALQTLEDIAARTGEAIDGLKDLTWIYCHGDCHGFNSRISAAGDAVFLTSTMAGSGSSLMIWPFSYGRRYLSDEGCFRCGMPFSRAIGKSVR